MAPKKKKAAEAVGGSPLKKAKTGKVAVWEWKDGSSWKAYCEEVTGSGFMGLWVKDRCGYHLCQSCCSTRSEEMLDEEITLSIYRPPQDTFPGFQAQEDVLQVRIKTGSTVRALKEKLYELYGMPVTMQVLRRDIDSRGLRDEDQVACEDGDVLYLGSPFDSALAASNGGGHFDLLMSEAMSGLEAITGFLTDADSRMQEQGLHEISLNVVMPHLPKANEAKGPPERRCQIVVVVSARMAEVKEMALAELDVAGQDQCQVSPRFPVSALEVSDLTSAGLFGMWWGSLSENLLLRAVDSRTEERLEHLYASVGAKGKVVTTDFSFNKEYQTKYELNFAKMTQTNTESKKSRTVRRTGGEAVAVVKKAVWEWWSDEDEWEPFQEVDAQVLEKAYVAGETPFSTKKLSWNEGYDSLYIFDFTVMTQVNCDSKTSRKIQRTAAGGSKLFGHKDGEDDGYAGAVGFLSDKIGDSKVMFAGKFEPSLTPAAIAAQKKIGAQSLRKQKKDYGPIVSKDEHGRKCFDEMLQNEKEFCGEWVVFYHSYSSAALLYEVQASVASVLFRFKAEFASLPRLLCAPFHHIPTAKRMLEEFPKWKDQDHNQAFRLVGLCGTSSLLAHDSEAPAKSVFLAGYSVGPLKGVLEKLLTSCGVPSGKIKKLAADIIALAVKSGLDCSGIPGGKKCKSGRSGHMLQIFLRRELCDEYVYPSFPFGVPDKKRMKPTLGKYLTEDVKIEGQVRITLNPDVFLRATTARMFTFSADPTFHKNRPDFQEELKSLLEPILGTEAVRKKAASGIFGGDPPDWWSAEDQSDMAKMSKGRYGSSSLD
ncbi:trip12 [Symbiodinium natans]|uniref:Trip12 protein n=1 Tax=Symbiodinium natans TaxID=878477 RepID=A0A812HS09_9DINO|nr:trip12 [Symbiodinium natans]